MERSWTKYSYTFLEYSDEQNLKITLQLIIWKEVEHWIHLRQLVSNKMKPNELKISLLKHNFCEAKFLCKKKCVFHFSHSAIFFFFSLISCKAFENENLDFLSFSNSTSLIWKIEIYSSPMSNEACMELHPFIKTIIKMLAGDEAFFFDKKKPSFEVIFSTPEPLHSKCQWLPFKIKARNFWIILGAYFRSSFFFFFLLFILLFQ